MPVPGLDNRKCAQRLRVAAKRDGIESAPIRFLRAPDPSNTRAALGTLPKDDADALARINALRGPDSEPLTEDDVYIHYAEAANTSFIADRYAFLATSTLKNIAKDAQSGFAFMNSHRTGGLSHPSELPFGRTFAGRWERMQDGSERALIGFFMLRGESPNGTGGPTTDALHRGIDAGTIFDVSVGLYGGTMRCDVCGNSVRDYENCPHLPGTTYGMSDEQKQAQRDKGVADGCASYTMDDCHCGETSAVYDGAVPGAGFRKALSLARSRQLPKADVAQARHVYASLLSKGDLPMGEDIIEAIQNGFHGLAVQLGLRARDTQTTPANPATNPELTTTTPNAASHPVLTAALAAGIDTPEKFAAFQQNAAHGEIYLAAKREEAKKLAVVALGNDTDEARKNVEAAQAFLETASLETVQAHAAQYEALGKKAGLLSADGKAQPRQSAAAALPHAVDAGKGAELAKGESDEKKVVLETAPESYARRKRELNAYKG